MKKWAILTGLLFISGCGGAIRTVSVQEQVNKINEMCISKYQSVSKTAIVECIANRVPSVIQKSGYPHMDLVNLLYTHMVAIIRDFDAGRISETDVKTRMAELEVRINTEEQRRNAMSASIHAQQRANALLLYQMLQPR